MTKAEIIAALDATDNEYAQARIEDAGWPEADLFDNNKKTPEIED